MNNTEKQRTLTQNRALHKYFTLLAEELNEAGLETQTVLAQSNVEIPWNGNLVKELLWRPVMKAQLGKRSTTKMNTKDIDKVYDTLNRYLSENFSLTVRFPSNEELMLQD